MTSKSKRAVLHAQELLIAAAVDATHWPSAVEAVADACASRVGQIICTGPRRDLALSLCTGTSVDFAQIWEGYGLNDPARNPRYRAGMTMPLMTPVVDEQYIDAKDRRYNQVYRELYGPSDFWFHCQAAVVKHDDMLVRMSVTRTKREGPLDAESLLRFQELLPSVRAAARLQIVLSETRTAGMVQAFDLSSSTAILLDVRGALVGVSLAGEQLLRDGRQLSIRDGRIEAVAQANRALFEVRLASALINAAAGEPIAADTLVLQACDGLSRVSVEFHSLPRERNIFDCGAVLLLQVKPVDDERERMEALRKNFQLTQTEAAVTTLLVAGLSPSSIAAERGVSLATVRSQIQAVYSKLDIHRQAELVKLIARLEPVLRA